MSEDQKKQFEQQHWNIANTLFGKINIDKFRDYILGSIFYKYLSERIHPYANVMLKEDGILYEAIRIVRWSNEIETLWLGDKITKELKDHRLADKALDMAKKNLNTKKK